VNTPNKMELIGQQKVINMDRKGMKVSLVHSKNVTEELYLAVDENPDWNGIGHLAFELLPWYGASLIKGEQNILTDEVHFQVERELIFRLDEAEISAAGTVPASILVSFFLIIIYFYQLKQLFCTNG